jgi:hypothetical protein
VTAPTAGSTARARRLPPEPLLDWLTANNIPNVELLREGIHVRWDRETVTDRIIDRIACHYGLHPTAIYGDAWWDDLLEDVTA